MLCEHNARWTVHSLYDLADYQNGYPFKPSEMAPVGLPIVRIRELNSGISHDTNHFAGELPVRFRIGRGNLLFAWSASVGIYQWPGPDAILNQHIFRVVARPGVDQHFLRYLLVSQMPVFQGIVADQATTMGHVKIADLKRLRVRLPPVSEQRAIAAILGTLDDKIELNRRMNRTLEAMAQALFQSWFVDFDPVRAKMVGRQPAGMDAETAALFPNQLDESLIGTLPIGWTFTSLDQIATFHNGLALQKYPAEDSEWLPVIKIAELHAGLTETTGRASPRLDPKYIVEDGDVLFSWSGSLEVVLWAGGRGALNQHLFKVTSTDYPRWFYYCWTKAHLPEFRAIAAGKATTMGHIQRHHLASAMVLVPPSALLSHMTTVVEPLFSKIVHGAVENWSLATIRDALLPMLLSGELRVSEAEKLVGSAV